MAYNMAGGNPNTYLIGRGKLMVKGEAGRYLGPALDGFRDVGDVSALSITFESETKEHTSFLSGINTIDQQIPVSSRMTVNFTADEASIQNLKLFFQALMASGKDGWPTPNAAALASNTGSPANYWLTPSATAQLFDVWYELNLTVGGTTFRAYDFQDQGTQPITVYKDRAARGDTSGGTLMTEGTHYVLDRRMGLIKFLEVAGGVTRGGTIQVNWAVSTDPAKAGGNDTQLNYLFLQDTTNPSLHLKFVGENVNADAGTGRYYELNLWKVKLTPDGEYAAIGDEFGGFPFTGVAEAVEASAIPFGASKYGNYVIRNSYST